MTTVLQQHPIKARAYRAAFGHGVHASWRLALARRLVKIGDTE